MIQIVHSSSFSIRNLDSKTTVYFHHKNFSSNFRFWCSVKNIGKFRNQSIIHPWQLQCAHERQILVMYVRSSSMLLPMNVFVWLVVCFNAFNYYEWWQEHVICHFCSFFWWLLHKIHFDTIIIIVSCFSYSPFRAPVCVCALCSIIIFHRNLLRYSLSALLILVSVALGLLSRHVCIKASIVLLFCSIQLTYSIPFGFVYILLSHRSIARWFIFPLSFLCLKNHNNNNIADG